MQVKKIEGIVISANNYSESSKILNIYTKELGIIGVLSKGCRKIKSQLRSASNKLTYGEFIISYKENGLSTLIGVDIIHDLKNIVTDINKISYATYILELKYLKYLGIDISIDGCSDCGCSNDIVTLSSDKGGYICKDCYNGETVVSDKTIKVIQLFYYVDIAKLDKVSLAHQTVKEINSFLEEYYDKYSGLYLKSKHFLKILNN